MKSKIRFTKEDLQFNRFVIFEGRNKEKIQSAVDSMKKLLCGKKITEISGEKLAEDFAGLYFQNGNINTALKKLVNMYDSTQVLLIKDFDNTFKSKKLFHKEILQFLKTLADRDVFVAITGEKVVDCPTVYYGLTEVDMGKATKIFRVE